MTQIQFRQSTKNPNNMTQTSTLYELVDAVSSSVEPGEESMIPLIVSQILSSCNATLENP